MLRTMKKNLLLLLMLPAILAGALALTAMSFRSVDVPNSPREIVLAGQDNAFQFPDRPDERNPTLRFKKGQPVRLILRNDDPQRILHCFTISGLNVKTSRNLAGGESEVLAFTPTTRGVYAYACLMHPMMGGSVVVE